MVIKLILTDMDGTVLRNDKTVSQETLRLLATAMEQGYLFAPATGRFLKALPQGIRNLHHVRYAILMNGAIVYDTKGGLWYPKDIHKISGENFLMFYWVDEENGVVWITAVVYAG